MSRVMTSQEIDFVVRSLGHSGIQTEVVVSSDGAAATSEILTYTEAACKTNVRLYLAGADVTLSRPYYPEAFLGRRSDRQSVDGADTHEAMKS